MGLPPGESRTFAPEEAVSVKFNRGYSLHEWDVMRSIEMSRELGEAPGSILIFAVQPGSVREGAGISSYLEGRMDEYMARLLDLIG
jgi:hydrogenase maturation protease